MKFLTKNTNFNRIYCHLSDVLQCCHFLFKYLLALVQSNLNPLHHQGVWGRNDWSYYRISLCILLHEIECCV
jgi:hypothetical protein